MSPDYEEQLSTSPLDDLEHQRHIRKTAIKRLSASISSSSAGGSADATSEIEPEIGESGIAKYQEAQFGGDIIKISDHSMKFHERAIVLNFITKVGNQIISGISDISGISYKISTSEESDSPSSDSSAAPAPAIMDEGQTVKNMLAMVRAHNELIRAGRIVAQIEDGASKITDAKRAELDKKLAKFFSSIKPETRPKSRATAAAAESDMTSTESDSSILRGMRLLIERAGVMRILRTNGLP